MSRGHADSVLWGDLSRIDVRDALEMKRVFRFFQPDAVMHFAALAYVDESMREPERYVTHNVGSTQALLEVMRATSVDALVFSSSCAVYGTPRVHYIDEMQPTAPINPYGLSKLLCEETIRLYCRLFGMRATTLRYFNAAGADPDGILSERHTPEPHLIPSVVTSWIDGNSLTVNGTDYPTPDGTCIRDYVHVTDLAEAHVLAIEAVVEAQDSTVLNLGSGLGSSIKDVIDAVSALLGPGPEVRVGPRRAGDPPRLCADAAMAQEVLGWYPKRSSLQTILADTVASIRKQRGLL